METLWPVRHAAGVVPHVLIQLAVGRVLLSWLPPGRLGGHRPLELPATLGTSYLLGEAILALQSLLSPAWGDAQAWGWHLVPWGVLGIVRLATLPGSFVPGAEPRHEAPGKLFWGLVLFLVVLGGLLTVPPLVLAFLPVASHLLQQGRRAPLGRVALLIPVLWILAAGASPPSPLVRAGILFGAGAGFLIPWLRRNDLRAAWLSAIFFAASAQGGLGLFLLTGWGTLLLASRRPQWRSIQTAFAVLSPLALGVVLSGRAGLCVPDPNGLGVLLVVLLGSLAASALRWSKREPWRVGRIEAPFREGVAIWVLLATALASLLLHGRPVEEVLLPLTPVGAMWVGVTFLWTEPGSQ